MSRGVEERPGCLGFLRSLWPFGRRASDLPPQVARQLEWLESQPDLQDRSGALLGQALRDRGPTQRPQTKRRLRVLPGRGRDQGPPDGGAA